MEYGLRIGEVIAIQKDCVDFTKNELMIKRSFSNGQLRETTKTGRGRYYQITGRSYSILFKEINTGNKFNRFVFSRSEGDTPYSPRNLNSLWKPACESCGIKIELYNAIRHSLGCQLLDEGQPLELVRDILGHTSTNMTRRYAHRHPAPQ